MSRASIPCVALLTLLLPHFRPEFVDRAEHPILSGLDAAALERNDIDILQSWGSKSEFARYRQSPQNEAKLLLAPLLGFDEVDLGSTERLARVRKDAVARAWMREFESGVLSGLCAVQDDAATAPRSLDEFRKRWRATAVDRRIFLSFTAADADFARHVQESLSKQGYSVFVFTNETGKPKYSAEIAGRMFAEAGHHLVLESRNAHRSLGVELEARLRREIEARRSAIQARELERQRIAQERERARLRALEDARRAELQQLQRQRARAEKTESRLRSNWRVYETSTAEARPWSTVRRELDWSALEDARIEGMTGDGFPIFKLDRPVVRKGRSRDYYIRGDYYLRQRNGIF